LKKCRRIESEGINAPELEAFDIFYDEMNMLEYEFIEKRYSEMEKIIAPMS